MLYLEPEINGIQCVRKYRFESSHSESNIKFNELENRSIYGKEVLTHGHNYELQVLLQGHENVKTGMVIELSLIDEIIDLAVISEFDHQNLYFSKYPCTHENFILKLKCILEDKIPYFHGLILIEDLEKGYTKVLKGINLMIQRTYITTFNSTHQLYSLHLNEFENKTAFGKCQRLHGHNYKLSVTLSGNINKKTGLLVKTEDFENLINKVVERFDYEKLNDFSDFNNCPATTENFIKIIWRDINSRLQILLNSSDYKLTNYFSKDVKLEQICLQETDRNIFTYKGE